MLLPCNCCITGAVVLMLLFLVWTGDSASRRRALHPCWLGSSGTGSARGGLSYRNGRAHQVQALHTTELAYTGNLYALNSTYKLYTGRLLYMH